MKVLITGANGFVGRSVVATLSQEYDLLTHDSTSLDLLETDAKSLASYLIIHDIKAIVHLAGNVGGIGYNQNNQGLLGFENLQMGLNVLEAARIAKIKKLIMVGTTCSYPCNPKTIPFIESELFDGMPEMTNSGYGIAKRTLVKLSIEYSKQYNMDITSLIPANMYGPGDHFDESKSHVIPALIKKFEDNKKYNIRNSYMYRCHCQCHVSEHVRHIRPCCDNGVSFGARLLPVTLWGTGTASREFLYVEDFARAVAIALEKNTGPEPINIGTGSEITIADLATLINKTGLYEAGITWDSSKPDGQPRRCLNIDRARSILRWEPVTQLADGLRTTINWYRQHE